MRLAMELSNGAEVLIHIGLDTVNMNGDGFTLLTQQDAQVKAGDPLIRFDRDAIAKAGYNTSSSWPSPTRRNTRR